MKSIRLLGLALVLTSGLASASSRAGELQKGQAVIGIGSPPSLLVYDHDGVFVESLVVPEDLPPLVYKPVSSVYDARIRTLVVATVAGNFGQ